MPLGTRSRPPAAGDDSHRLRMPARLVSRAALVAAVGLALSLAVGCDSGDPPAAPPELPPERVAYPLQPGAAGLFLRDANGDAAFLQGDAAWSMVVNLDREAVDRYFATRAAQGFNAVYVSLVEWAFSNQDPPWRNVYGDDPFVGTVDGYVPDMGRPNEAYWRHVDYVFERAEAEGILVIAFPAYSGWMQGFDGWAYGLENNDEARLRTYGEFLGGRYAGQPNVLWAAGGDWGPTGQYDLRDDYATIVDAIRSRDPEHLWTAHGGQQSGVSAYGYLGLDLNTTYRYPPASVPEAIHDDRREAPGLPVVFFEGHYENERGVTTRELRFQAYNSVLGGATGHFYGNNPVWEFLPGWERALRDPGAEDMVHVGALFRSRPVGRLEPDDAARSVVSDRGDKADGSYVGAARASDGATVIAYVPRDQSVTVALGRLSGAEAQAWCYDPRSGDATDLGRYATEGEASFGGCTGEDWVLVVDDAARGYARPGRR